MGDKQTKNTIKTVVTVLLLVVFGEGVFGWGVYWPFLLTLLDWSGIYWLSLGVGVLISVLRGLSIGLPSLFVLVIIGLLSLVMNAKKEMSWAIIVIGVVSSIVTDVIFGLGWSVWEVLAVVIAGFLAVSWFERSETIRINY